MLAKNLSQLGAVLDVTFHSRTCTKLFTHILGMLVTLHRKTFPGSQTFLYGHAHTGRSGNQTIDREIDTLWSEIAKRMGYSWAGIEADDDH